MCISLYMCTKIVHLVFYLSSKAFKKLAILSIINSWFSKNTKWWTLIVAFIESNMIAIAFMSFKQLRSNSIGSFIFQNKLNFAFTSLAIFVFFAYGLCFYMMAYRYAARSSAPTLLNYAGFRLGGFFVESCCRIVRNFVKGLIHAYFIYDYKTQIISLIASDALFVVVALYFTRSFKTRIFRVLYIFYYILFLILDSLLFI